MLSTFSNSSLSLSSSSSSPLDKPSNNAPYKLSECQTNHSSSCSLSLSNNNLLFNEYNSLFNLHLNVFSERIIQEICQTQTSFAFDNDVSTYTKDNNLYFKSRINILQWIDEVLNSSSLSIENKNSIYYRFAYGYVITTLELTKRNIFYNKTHFKVFIVALFLLCYKLEGLTVQTLTIKTMINTFLMSVNILEEDLSLMIREMEIQICELLNYDLCIFENNLHQMSQLLFHMISNTLLNCNEDVIETVSFNLEQTNFEIENSNDVYLLFQLHPIERGLVSLVSALLVSEPNVVDSCVDYFINEFNITQMSKESVLTYSHIYAQQINKDDDDDD